MGDTPGPLDRFAAAGRLGGPARQRRYAKGQARRWLGKEPERDRLIRERRDADKTLAAIGLEFGISRERVRQILERAA
jgi:DNA-directed RNA polymerase sigma subunit (sigma70/sigma32)